MRIAPAVSLLALTALPAAAQPVVQPGLYSISAQIVVPGLPLQMPVMTFRRCLTPQDIVDGQAYASSPGKDCTIDQLSQSADRVSYDFNCAMEGGQRVIGRASGTTHATGYDIKMDGRFVPGLQGMSEFSQKLSATRLGGDCP